MQKKKKKPLLYFFYEGYLHKKQRINRSTDLITAFKYSTGTLEKYNYTDVKRYGKKAYSTKEVCAMIGRGRLSVENAILKGHIKPPEKTYSIDERRSPFAWKWNEDNVLELHDHFIGVHIGRPRKDGEISPGRGLPTRKELRAMLREREVYYVQTDDGRYVPTWNADNL